MNYLKSHHPGPWNVGQVSWNEDGDVTYTLRGIKEARHADMLLIDAAPDFFEALVPFAKVFEHDIGSDEADADLFQVINNNRAPKLTVGDFRRAYNALINAGVEL